MSLDDLLGRRAALRIWRLAGPGAYVGPAPGDGRDAILLPAAEVPAGAREGDLVDVFVHRDSEAKLLATTRTPRLELGQVAFLEVMQCTRVGAFVDWGLPKELLVPFAEQTTEPRPGDRHPIGLYVDSSGRLAGTMRVSEMVGRGTRRATTKSEADEPGEPGLDAWLDGWLDTWVDGEAWRNDPEIGLLVIVEKEHVGLVPASEPHRLSRGQAARFRVSNVLPDGRIELSLRGHAHEELEQDAERILEVLVGPAAGSGAPRVGDRSSPEEIRRLFGLSKKAFKRAAGRLLKERRVTIDDDGFLAPVRPTRASAAGDGSGRA